MMTAGESVVVVRHCALSVCDQPWPFAQGNSEAIEQAWEAKRAANPDYFNGVVHLMRADQARLIASPDGPILEGQVWRSDFKTFLYWRDKGCSPADNATECFGSVILRGRDGPILLGRQRAGLNAGQTYLPGGFIDGSDIGRDGSVDIVASIARELAEETGVEAAHLTQSPGYVLTRTGTLLSIGIEFKSPLTATELRRDILDRIATDPTAELDDIVVIASPADLEGRRVPRYTQLAVQFLLQANVAG